MKNYFVHDAALVETNNIGEGSKVWAFVHILKGAKIGKNANICDHCFIENDVTIGDNVTVKCGVYLWDGITIEDDVFIGPAAAFTNDLFPRSKNSKYKQEKIVLKKGSSIGANATILAGTTIGEYALIGAGSVITKNVPDYALIYGNPGEIKGYVCICTKKIDVSKLIYSCSCKRKYSIKSGVVRQEL
jgi:acetyltransferase-like isoleucine patch superfamily enzyme